MRVFVVLASSIVALGFLAYSLYEPGPDDDPNKPNWLRDFMDGTYLLQKYQFLKAKITGTAETNDESTPWSLTTKICVGIAILAGHVGLFAALGWSPSGPLSYALDSLNSCPSMAGVVSRAPHLVTASVTM